MADSEASPKPVATDGRDVDPEKGILSGEGAGQQIEHIEPEHPTQTLVRELPTEFPVQEQPTYYGQPAIKEPVWKPSIGVYFFVGGVAGAASVLGAAATLVGGPGLGRLKRRARLLSIAGDVAGAVLLIEDLGRPERFLHMLRVFRPTSPMSMGAWILAAQGGVSTLSFLSGLPGKLGRMGRGAELASGVTGAALSGYTAVLISNTAVPIWQQARRQLPVLFVASSVASAASLLSLMRLTPREKRIVQRFGLVGRAAELLAGRALETAVGRVPEVARPLREGISGRLWRGAKLLTATSLLLSLVPPKYRWATVAAGVAGAVGALTMRMAVVRAGRVSAEEPKATFAQQHAASVAAR